MVNKTDFGTFRIEIDAILIQNLANIAANPSHAEDKLSEFLDDGIKQLIRLTADLSTGIVPTEIVTPPIPQSQLGEIDKLTSALRNNQAFDTRNRFYHAFGLHLNPEILSEDIDYIRRHMQAFVLLSPWLFNAHDVDITRRLTSYIAPFPNSYITLILEPNYQPNLTEFIHDYHTHNPTRNRPLDLLPLLAHLSVDEVKHHYKDKIKINSRPTFHYRLPNCELEGTAWSIQHEWLLWLVVEKLATTDDCFDQLLNLWLQQQEDWFNSTPNWIATVDNFIKVKLT